MDFVRGIIDNSLLDKINLPLSLKNRKVEIIILPIDDKKEAEIKSETISIESVIGILSEYKNPDLIPLEKKYGQKLWWKNMVIIDANVI